MPTNSNLPVFHTYVTRHDEARPWTHFDAAYIGQPILLKAVADRATRMARRGGEEVAVITHRDGAPAYAVRLMAIRYDAKADAVVIDVAGMADGKRATITDPAAWDVFPPRGGENAGRIEQHVRERGKLRAKWYKHYGAEDAAAWRTFYAPIIGVVDGKHENASRRDENTAALAAAVAEYVAAHPVAPKAGAKGGHAKAVSTDLSALLAPRPASVPTADEEAEALAEANA